MKKRIISFLLVLVMLLSAMSLNIFAAEPDEEPAGGECVHEWVESHSHDVENSSITYIKTCKLCGEVEKDTVYSGADNYDFTAEEIKAIIDAENSGLTSLVNGEFAEETRDPANALSSFASVSFLKKSKTNGGKEIVSVKDEEGDRGYYIKWQAPVFDDGTPTGKVTNEYLDWAPNVTVNTTTQAKWDAAKENGYFGAAFIVTMDFMWYGEGLVGDLLTLNSYVNDKGTGSNIGAKDFPRINVQVAEDGTLKFYDNGVLTTEYMEDGGAYKLTPGEWVQLSLYITPRGLNGVRDLEFSEDASGNITATKTADYDDNTYHAFVNGVHIGTFQNKMKTYNDYNFKVDGEYYNSNSDMVIGLFRFGQTNVYKAYDQFAIDDLRIYRGQGEGMLQECAHSDFVDQEYCKWCYAEYPVPYCELCDEEPEYSGELLGNGVVVTGRDATLGEKIDLGVYFELDEDVLADETAKIVVAVDDGFGTKIETAVSELEADGDGMYVVSIPLRSIDLTKRITLSLVSNGELVGAPYTTTAAAYFKALYNASEDEAEKALVEAALNYGAYAQGYFAAKNGDTTINAVLPNAGYKIDVAAVADPNLADYALAVNGDASALTGISLVLTSQAQMKIYFTDAITAVKIGGADAEIVAEGGKYYVLVEGASPAELGAAKEIAFTYANGSTVTVTASVYSVLKNIIAQELPEDVESAEYKSLARYRNLAKAMYLYGEAAAAYAAN